MDNKQEAVGGAGGPHAFSLPCLFPGDRGSLLGSREKWSPSTMTHHCVEGLVCLQPPPTPTLTHTIQSGTRTLTFRQTLTYSYTLTHTHTHPYTHLPCTHTYTHTHTYSCYTHPPTDTFRCTHICMLCSHEYSQEGEKSAVHEIGCLHI